MITVTTVVDALVNQQGSSSGVLVLTSIVWDRTEAGVDRDESGP